MRVLRVSHSSVVSAWRERDRQLKKRGVEVSLVCASAWDEGGALVHLVPGEDDFVEGVRTFGRHPNLFLYDPRRLWRLLGDPRFALLDLHEEPFSLAAAEVLLLRLVRRSRMPFIVYSAQNLDKVYPPPFGWIERLTLASAAGANVCSQAAGARLRKRGLRGELSVLPLGVDVDAFHPAARAAPSPPLKAGFVGRLARHKGVHVLLDALVGLDNWTLEIVGGGPERDALVDLSEALGLGGRVTFSGYASQEDLAACYRTFDLLVVPSLPSSSWTEQFGRVVVEAMASGVPVVASDSGALPEIVGDAGVLAPAGDPIALREAMASLADPGRWETLRTAGLARAQGYSWGSVADGQLALYKRACA